MERGGLSFLRVRQQDGSLYQYVYDNLKQLNELAFPNQTGQTQKWVYFRKKVLTRLFQ